MSAALRTRISHEGQPYVDEAVMVHAKPLSIIEASVGSALDPNFRPKPPITVRHDRVYLRWVKPVESQTK